jgi:hypothetical protein
MFPLQVLPIPRRWNRSDPHAGVSCIACGTLVTIYIRLASDEVRGYILRLLVSRS